MMKCLQFLLANYNSAEHIEILIKSLRTYHPGFTYEILVCDNGSTDGSDVYLESLEEVRLWRYSDRDYQHWYNAEQQSVIDEYELTPYLQGYIKAKSVDFDYRRSHQSALQFLLQKVDSPLFATLDSDIEFLGPHWITPFMHALLADSNTACVGFAEQQLDFNIGYFEGRVLPRIHPCVALWRTNVLKPQDLKWSASREFDLRFPIMLKSAVERTPIQLTMYDTSWLVTDWLQKNGHGVINLSAQEFFTSCRHFYGATVEKVYFGNAYESWIDEINDKYHGNVYAEQIAQFMLATRQYSRLSRPSLENSKRFWSGRNPCYQKQPHVPLVILE